MRILRRFFSGVLIGAANIIPGVSGGTIAVVMGVFDDMIHAINNLRRQFKKSAVLLLPILLGMAVGILALSRVLETALDRYAFPTSMFFVGLVAGSIPLIWRKANEGGPSGDAGARGFSWTYLIPFVLSAAVVVVMSLFTGDKTAASIDDISVLMMVQLFFAGAVAAAAMVIPGISGSFVMILLGFYKTVLALINGLMDWLSAPSLSELLNLMKGVLPLGVGILLGIVLISKLIDLLLRKFYSYTYYAILGLVAASIFGVLYNPDSRSSGMELRFRLLAVAACALGAVLALWLGRERKTEPEEAVCEDTGAATEIPDGESTANQ